MKSNVFGARWAEVQRNPVLRPRTSTPLWQPSVRRSVDALDVHHNVVVLQPLQAWGAVPRFQPHLAPLTRVFLAVQYPWFSYDAIRLALELAHQHRAQLEFVYVIDAFKEIFHHHNEALINDADAFLACMQLDVDAIVATATQQGVECSGSVRAGSPAIELAREVSYPEMDLVVLNVDEPAVHHILETLGACRIQWSGWPSKG